MCIGSPQISYAVVRFVAVDVVEMVWGLLAKMNGPCDSVRFEHIAVQTDLPIPKPRGPAGYGTGRSPYSYPFFPPKFARSRIVIQQFPGKIDRDQFARRHVNSQKICEQRPTGWGRSPRGGRH